MRLSKLRRSAAIAVVLGLTATGSYAQQISLRSTDGTISVNGDLQSFENNVYTINTSLGQLNIAADNVVCEGDACPEIVAPGGVFIAGSDTVGDGLMPLLIEGFAQTIGGVAEATKDDDGNDVTTVIGDDGLGDEIGNFKISATSSGDAFTALLSRSTNIGMASRRIRPQEARSLRDAGGGNMISAEQEHIIAADSINIAVHPDNPINSLSLDEVDQIYSGLITNWSQVGGLNDPITVYGRSAGSGTRAVFEERVFERSGRSPASVMQETSSNEEIAEKVGSDRNAIGYIAGAFTRGAKPLSLEGTCSIVIAPGTFASKTEEYPLQRRLYLYNRTDNLNDPTRDLIAYSLSEEADSVISKAGFINLGIERVAQDASGTRMRRVVESTTDPVEFGLLRELLVDMFGWDRLSTTFRFASGSSQLDQKARRDLERLVNYLRDAPDGTQVAFVGFTDSDGDFEANRGLSAIRAQQVAASAAQIIGNRLPNIRFSTKGFGELAPTACNDTLEGKRINRRVEVWIRRNDG